jgi:hypothetical protein
VKKHLVRFWKASPFALALTAGADFVCPEASAEDVTLSCSGKNTMVFKRLLTRYRVSQSALILIRKS